MKTMKLKINIKSLCVEFETKQPDLQIDTKSYKYKSHFFWNELKYTVCLTLVNVFF